MNQRTKPPSTAPSSLVLFPGALGDFICLLPTLERISLDARVDVLARTEFSDLVSASITVGSLERYEINRLCVTGSSEEQRLRDFFSAYASVYSWFGSGQALFAEELRRVIRGHALLFPFRPVAASMHQIDYYLSCLGQPPGAVPSISLKTNAETWCDEYWRQHGLGETPLLVLAPGSGAREKNWPVPSYQTVADWWRQEFHGRVIVVLGPVEEERGGLASLCRGSLVARRFTLGQLAALLSRCVLYLGNDSGTTHLAAALGVRTVALFGPSEPRYWGPRGARVVVIRKGIECSPCAVASMKACAHRDCLVTLQPADVIERLASLPEVATGSIAKSVVSKGENLPA